MIAPQRIFISHAGADWERVVKPVAAGLRENNLTVVTENWDDRKGERLVRRILEEELRVSRAAVIVLSVSSVDQSWVREELDRATVSHIAGKIRLLLLHIDDCPVPAPLQTLTKIPVSSSNGQDDRFRDVIEEIELRARHPPLTPPANPSADHPPRGLKPVEWSVLTLLGDIAWNQEGDWISVKDVYQRASELGLTDDQTTHTLGRLTSRGLAQGQKYTFGQHYASLKFTASGAGKYCRAVFPEFDSWKVEVAARVASRDVVEYVDLGPEDDFPSLVFRTAIDELLAKKLIRGYWFPGVNLARIFKPSPNLENWLDRQMRATDSNR